MKVINWIIMQTCSINIWAKHSDDEWQDKG